MMFGFFKKKSLAAIDPPALIDPPTSIEPPTDKQRRYARALGIEITPDMDKSDVSAAIAAAEQRNPSVAAERCRIKKRIRIEKYGVDLIDQEDRWENFAEDGGFMLAVYLRGQAYDRRCSTGDRGIYHQAGKAQAVGCCSEMYQGSRSG
jgi:hypothetical protein